MNAVVHAPVPSLRPLDLTDLSRVVEIETRTYRQGWNKGIFADCLRIGYSSWGLAIKNWLIGYGLASIAVGESHLLNLAVDPDYQGRGYGRFLLHHLCALAVHGGATRMFLEVRPSNVSARSLYQSVGFHEVGRRSGYYPQNESGKREDALILCRCFERLDVENKVFSNP